MNDRPVWIGIAMRTADGRIQTWQMTEPLRMEMSQQFSARDPYGGVTTEFRITGGASFWQHGADAAAASALMLEAGLKEIENDHRGDGDRGFGSISDLPHL